MMILIDKEQTFQTLSEYYHHAGTLQHMALREALDRVPVVDAVPVVHGHWWHDEDADLNELTCSVCNKTYRMMMDLRANVYPHNYCPNCGAKMGWAERRENET